MTIFDNNFATAPILARQTVSWRHVLGALMALAMVLAHAGNDSVPAWRELHIPAAELPRILQSWPGATMLRQEDFQRLLQANSRVATAKPPVAALLGSAAHRLTVLDDRAHWECQATAETLVNGTHLLDIAAEGVTWTTVQLREQPAAATLDGGQLSLLLEGKPARHALFMQGEVAVDNDGAQRRLSCLLPDAPSRELTIVVPGDVALRSGPPVLSRTYDEKAKVTTFALIPPRGQLELTLSLNNRFKRDASLVRAVSRLHTRIGLAGEELTADVRLLVHHHPIASWRFAVPAGFEVLGVASSSACGIASWSVDADRVLTIVLQEPLNGQADFSFRLYRTGAASTTAWAFPAFQPLDCASAVTYVWAWADRHLACRQLTSTGLVFQQLAHMPHEADIALTEDQPLIAAGYAPGAFQLSAVVSRPDPEIEIASATTLDIRESGLLAHARLTVTPVRDLCFQVQVLIPEGWKYEGEGEGEGAADSAIEIGLPGRDGRLTIRFPHGLAPGQPQSFQLALKSAPPGWEQDWTAPRQVSVPMMAAPAAARQTGRIMVQAHSPLIMTVQRVENCLPRKHDSGNREAYMYSFQSQPAALTLAVERPSTRLSAGAYTLVKVNPDHLAVTHEVVFTARRSPVRDVSCRLPAEAPAALSVQGLPGTVVKEHSSQMDAAGRRVITALLAAETSRPAIRITYQMPLAADGQPKTAPLVDAFTAGDQHGHLAVEGASELDVTIRNPPRAVDVGELISHQTQPGRRLLGVYAYTGAPPDVNFTVTRQAVHALPAVLIREGRATTVISPNGIAQHTIVYAFRPSLPHLNIVMPPEADLWAVVLDDEPATLQQCSLPPGTGQPSRALLLPLPPATATERTLAITFETPARAFRWLGTMDAALPTLGYVNAEGAWTTAPAANLTWEIITPPQYRPVAAAGNVTPSRWPASPYRRSSKAGPEWLPEPIAPQVGRFLYACTGKITPRHGLFGLFLWPALNAARHKARMIDKLGGGKEEFYTVEAAERFLDETPAMEKTRKLNRKTTMLDADTPAAPAAEPAKPQMLSLEATRSLPIDLVREGRTLLFRGLSGEAAIRLTLLNNTALRLLRRGLFLLVICIGLLPVVRKHRRWRYVIAWLLASSILPCLPGLGLTALLLNDCFIAALVLAALYVLGGAVLWLARRCRPEKTAATTTAATPATANATAGMALLAAMLLPAFPQTTIAQTAATPATAAATGQRTASPPAAPPADSAAVSRPGRSSAPTDAPWSPAPTATPVELVKPTPVPLPDDAVIVPYDGRPTQLLPERLLPYSMYQRLRQGTQPPPFSPAPALFTTMGYTAILDEGDTLVITARMQAVIPAIAAAAKPEASAPALPGLTYQNVLPGRISANGRTAAAWVAPGPPACLSIASLPPGKHDLEITWLAAVTRQGGWRQVSIALPAPAPATLAITVPEQGAEIAVRGRRQAWTERVQAGSPPIDIAVDGDLFTLQWRLPTAQNRTDDTLAAESAIDLIVGESATEIAWRPRLQFRGLPRSIFELSVPSACSLLGITGNNIRGWESRTEGLSTIIAVHLLKAVEQAESFKVRLLAPGVGAAPAARTMAFPDLAIPAAARHRIVARVRRRGQFDLRTEPAAATAGRIDLTRLGQDFDTAAGEAENAEAWESAAAPLRLNLSIKPWDDSLEATVRVIHRLETGGQSLEGQLALKTGRRFRPAVLVRFPAGLAIRTLTGDHLFSHDVETTADATHAVLRLLPGVQDTAIHFAGELAVPVPAGSTVAVPTIRVLDADRQETVLAVLCAETLQVRERQLNGLTTVLRDTVNPWLIPANRPHVRLALQARSGDYGGELLVSAKPTTVTGMCAASVRFTETVQEETYLFDLNIDGGLEQFSFTAPKHLAEARLDAPLLRRTSIAPETDAERIRFTLEFQDQLTGNCRILLEHDRLPPGNIQTITCPAADMPLKYYCVIENAGRDEVSATPMDDGDALDLTRSAPEILQPLLEGNRVQAFEVKNVLTGGVRCQARPRAAVATAKARIGLASTTLTLAEDGLCQGETAFQIDNRTEQFLVVRLPDDTLLWTVQVAGELTKPVTPPAAEPGIVWIPLLKTAEGDLDYPVILKYRAQLRQPGWLRQTEFPLPVTVNVNIERTQVALRLPVKQKWLAFTGDLGQPVDAGFYHASTLAYQSGMLKRLTSSMLDSTSHSRLRAAKNSEVLRAQVQVSQMQVQQFQQANEQIVLSQRALDDFVSQVEHEQKQQFQPQAPTGRQQFNVMNAAQSASFANDLPDRTENWQRQAEPKVKAKAEGAAAMMGSDATAAPRDIVGNARQMPARGRSGDRTRAAAEPRPTSAAKPVTQAPQKGLMAGGLFKRNLDRDGQDKRDDDGDAMSRPQPLLAPPMAPGAATSGMAFDLAEAPAQPAEAAAAAANLASLDVPFCPDDPTRWQTLLFSSPRGGDALSGRTVSQAALDGWKRIGFVLLTAGVVAVVLLGFSRHGWRWLPARLRTRQTMRQAALISILFGILPVIGVIILAASYIRITPKA